MRVRRVALVEDRVPEAQRRSQVGIEIRQAATRDEALVDDRPRRGRRDGDLGKDAAGRPRGGLEPAARDDQAALEGIVGQRPRVIRAPRRTLDDRVGEGRSRVGGRGTKRRDVERHGPPRGDRQAALEERRLHERPGTLLRPAGPWQEQRDDARPRRPRSSPRDQRQQRARERQRDPGAIARHPVGPERATVAEGRQAGQRQRQHALVRPAARVRDEPDATGVVLEAFLVQRGDLPVAGSLVHGLDSREGGKPAAVDGFDCGRLG